jgi:hypothetical protein
MRKPLLAAACGLRAAGAASAQTLTFTTLDNPGDPTFNQLTGINDKRTIVGYFGSGAVGSRALPIRWRPAFRKWTRRSASTTRTKWPAAC